MNQNLLTHIFIPLYFVYMCGIFVCKCLCVCTHVWVYRWHAYIDKHVQYSGRMLIWDVFHNHSKSYLLKKDLIECRAQNLIQRVWHVIFLTPTFSSIDYRHAIMFCSMWMESELRSSCLLCKQFFSRIISPEVNLVFKHWRIFIELCKQCCLVRYCL